MTINTSWKILATSPSFSRNQTLCSCLQELAAKGDRLTVTLNTDGVIYSADDLKNLLAYENPEILIIGTEEVNEGVLDSAPNLKAVIKYGVGTDNLPLAVLKKRNLYFGWDGGINRRSVSELVVSFLIGHFRNVLPSLSRMREGQWMKNGGQLLSGRIVGIIGLGAIGCDLAQLLRPFGCQLLAYDIEDRTQLARLLGLEQVSYQELLARSDAITFHVPLDDTSRHMYSTTEVELTRPGGLVINTARGGVVDFEAVVAGVRAGKLSGFAADVFPMEPFNASTYPIEQGFYFTPHIGGNAAEAVLAMGMNAIKHVGIFLTSCHRLSEESGREG